MMSKRSCEQDKTVVIFSDLGPDLVAMYMAIYRPAACEARRATSERPSAAPPPGSESQPLVHGREPWLQATGEHAGEQPLALALPPRVEKGQAKRPHRLLRDQCRRRATPRYPPQSAWNLHLVSRRAAVPAASAALPSASCASCRGVVGSMRSPDLAAALAAVRDASHAARRLQRGIARTAASVSKVRHSQCSNDLRGGGAQ